MCSEDFLNLQYKVIERFQDSIHFHLTFHLKELLTMVLQKQSNGF